MRLTHPCILEEVVDRVYYLIRLVISQMVYRHINVELSDATSLQAWNCHKKSLTEGYALLPTSITRSNSLTTQTILS